jgi:hypothetical protein
MPSSRDRDQDGLSPRKKIAISPEIFSSSRRSRANGTKTGLNDSVDVLAPRSSRINAFRVRTL